TLRQARDVSMAWFATARSHRTPALLPHRLLCVRRDVVCRDPDISQRAPAETGELALLLTYLPITTDTTRDQTNRRRDRVDGLSERLGHQTGSALQRVARGLQDAEPARYPGPDAASCQQQTERSRRARYSARSPASLRQPSAMCCRSAPTPVAGPGEV